LAAAPINLFVGALQVVTPTYLIIAAAGDPRAISLAAGLYLFGFTYLWVGINALTGWPPQGLGWFSLFVAACAVGFAIHSAIDRGDRAFAVIWLFWSFLWLLFFLLLGLGQEHLDRFAGWSPSSRHSERQRCRLSCSSSAARATPPAWHSPTSSSASSYSPVCGSLSAMPGPQERRRPRLPSSPSRPPDAVASTLRESPSRGAPRP
jgi:hypothetical protein